MLLPASFASASPAARASAVVTSCVVSLAALSSMIDRRPPTDDPEGTAADVVRQSVQWSQTAAQDTDPLTRLQHLALAKAYLNVGRHVASDATLQRAANRDVRAMTKQVDAELQAVVAQLHRACPKLKPAIHLPRTADLPGERPKRVTWMS
jgi:hypothetical protein